MIDITALGELLIDFTEYGHSSANALLFERNPGGAVANVACGAARLGLKTAFIGKVGADFHGRFLQAVLQAEGVNTTNLLLDPFYPTTLAFVALSANGERDFSFFRRETADLQLHQSEINLDLIASSRILHIGTLSLTDEPARSTTLYAAAAARKAQKIVSCDINFRPSLWGSREDMIRQAENLLPFIDLLKVSNHEAQLLTCEANPRQASHLLLEKYPLSAVAVTCGEQGALVRTRMGFASIPAAPAAPIDTTGAGDAFWAAFLCKFLEANIACSAITAGLAKAFAEYAAAAAAVCVEARGAIYAMPDRSQVAARLHRQYFC